MDGMETVVAIDYPERLQKSWISDLVIHWR